MNLTPRNQKILAGLVATVVPVGYLVGLHIKWMQDTRERIRMALKHVGFWGGMTLGLVGLHKYIIRKKNPLSVDLAIAAGLSVLPVVGYEVSRRLAKKFFPSIKPNPAMMPLHDPLAQPELAPSPLDFQIPPMPEPTVKAPESVQSTYSSQQPAYPYNNGYSSYGTAYASPYQSSYTYPYNYYGWNPYSLQMR